METTTIASFEQTVEEVKDIWIMGNPMCTIQYVILTLNTKFHNLEGAIVWNKTSEIEMKIIAFEDRLEWSEEEVQGVRNKIQCKIYVVQF